MLRLVVVLVIVLLSLGFKDPFATAGTLSIRGGGGGGRNRVVAAALGVNAPYSEGQNRLYYYSSTAVEEVEERACDELYSYYYLHHHYHSDDAADLTLSVGRERCGVRLEWNLKGVMGSHLSPQDNFGGA